MAQPTPLKRAIFESGKRQKDIAAEVGLDEASMSRIVNGLHAGDATRQKIADALDTSVDALWPDVAEQAA